MAKQPTSITIIATPRTPNMGEEVYVHGTLMVLATGMPLYGRIITISGTGLLSFTVITDRQQGEYKAWVTFNSSGEKVINAKFAGDYTYEGC